jgi:hypothetical protein
MAVGKKSKVKSTKYKVQSTKYSSGPIYPRLRAVSASRLAPVSVDKETKFLCDFF